MDSGLLLVTVLHCLHICTSLYTARCFLDCKYFLNLYFIIIDCLNSLLLVFPMPSVVVILREVLGGDCEEKLTGKRGRRDQY